MESCIHSCLDGELPRAVLSRAEEAQLIMAEQMIEMVADAVRAEPIPDLSARVLSRLAEVREAPSPVVWLTAMVRGCIRWAWTPHLLVLRPRPAYAFGSVLVLLLLVIGRPSSVRDPVESGAEMAAREPPSLYVQFRLRAPNASRVSLAGTFTGWQPQHELWQSAPGVWTALVPLDPGIHDYLFVVDGEQWVADPEARQVLDSFGGTNSRLFLTLPSSRT